MPRDSMIIVLEFIPTNGIYQEPQSISLIPANIMVAAVVMFGVSLSVSVSTSVSSRVGVAHDNVRPTAVESKASRSSDCSICTSVMISLFTSIGTDAHVDETWVA